MARKVLESCPSCGGALEITEVHCLNCDARVQARFSAGDFNSLNEEQSTFLRIFVTSRGNLSDVEKRLGVSYPTVRAKLDEVIARLEAPRNEEETPGGPFNDTPIGASAWSTRMRAEAAAGASALGASLSAEIGAAVRGALSEVRSALDEARTAASWPSFNDSNSAAGQPESPREQPESPRRAILDDVARGELTPQEGLERIRQLGGE
jgi:hypothetical protein